MKPFSIRLYFLVAIFCALASPLAFSNSEFALTGSQFDQMVERLNQQPLQSVIHVGDFKKIEPCSDSYFQGILNQFSQSKHPLIYTPGNNEWADCHQGHHFNFTSRDPADALSKIRSLFFSARVNNEGIKVIRQSDLGDNSATLFDESKFVENQMWTQSDVLFVTIHTVGSMDDCVQRLVVGGSTVGTLGNTTKVPDSCSPEKIERQAANIAWLQNAFGIAKLKNLRGVVISTQANFSWDTASNTKDGTCPALNSKLRDGTVFNDEQFALCKAYEGYRLAIRTGARDFKKPVALLFGDNHFFRYFKPISDTPNLVGVMTNGSPNIGWVRGIIDAKDENVFKFSVGGCVTGQQLISTPPVNLRSAPTPSVCTQDAVGVKILKPESIAGNFEGFEGGGNATPLFGHPLSALPKKMLEGEVVYIGRGCPDPDGDGDKVADKYLADPKNKIALVDAGGCSDDNKVARAQTAGAIAVIRANSSDNISFPTGNSPVETGSSDVIGAVIDIPVIGVHKTVANRLKSAKGAQVSLSSPLLLLHEISNIHG